MMQSCLQQAFFHFFFVILSIYIFLWLNDQLPSALMCLLWSFQLFLRMLLLVVTNQKMSLFVVAELFAQSWTVKHSFLKRSIPITGVIFFVSF